jgi:hypothetical protein
VAQASQTISVAFVAVAGQSVGPGASGIWGSAILSVAGGTSFPNGTASLVACGKNDLGLTLP